jgi:hypothetical protein
MLYLYLVIILVIIFDAWPDAIIDKIHKKNHSIELFHVLVFFILHELAMKYHMDTITLALVYGLTRWSTHHTLKKEFKKIIPESMCRFDPLHRNIFKHLPEHVTKWLHIIAFVSGLIITLVYHFIF